MAKESKDQKKEKPEPAKGRGSRVDRFEESDKKETRTIPNKGK